MLENFANFFGTSNFSPHGYCFFWSPALLWTYVVSDLTIATSYFSIPFALWYFAKRRTDVPFRWVFVMFGVFVLACGTTHLLALWNIWHVDYWADAAVKAITASVSIVTAIMLWPLIPKALTIPSHAQLESANRELHVEVTRRTLAERELHTANENLERRVAERTAAVLARDAELSRFRLAMDAASDGIFLVDRTSMRFIDVNAAACSLWEQSREQMLALEPEAVRSCSREELERLYDSVIAGGAADEPVEIMRQRKDGTQIWLEFRCHAQRFYEDWIIVTVARDITRSRLAQQELAINQDRLRIALSNIDMAVFHQDRNLRYTWMYQAQLGYLAEQVVGHTDAELLPPEAARQVTELKQRVLDTGVTSRDEVAVAQKDATRFFDLTTEPLRDASGAIIGLTGVSLDITTRKMAEAKIHRLTQLYAALSQCNEAIVRASSKEELFPLICRSAVEFGGMKMAWIGMVDPDTQMIRPAGGFGVRAEEYMQTVKLSVDAGTQEGQGATGTAIRENHPVWCQDFQNDPLVTPWRRERRARFGLAASAALPLHLNGVPVGVLSLYAGEIGAFDEAARGLLLEMATDISFALDNFAREQAREQAQVELRAAEEQFRGLVEQSIAGIFILQDDRLAYANPRFAEIHGFACADGIIERDCYSFIAEKDRGNVKEMHRKILGGEMQSFNAVYSALCKNESTIEVGVSGARATFRGRPSVIGLMQDITEKKRAEDEIKRYVIELERAFMSTVEVATTLGEMRDPYTAGHQRRVAGIAVAIGAELGFDERRQEGLRVAGYLHDIGKINIPAELLSKPARLTPLEFQLIKGHARASYDVLKKVPFPWPVAEVALQHHERMDGSGYPQGLKGDAILLEARIMAVADVMEAMFSHRPYRPGLGVDKALAEIQLGRGTAYDPAVADACVKLFREKGYTIPEQARAITGGA